MSWDIIYTIRENKKTMYKYESLFFGEKWAYDYKKVTEKIFYSLDEAWDFIIENDLKDVHIRKLITSGGEIIKKEYFIK